MSSSPASFAFARFGFFVLGVVTFAASPPAGAEIWDATADFSADQNPNGVWSSGWTATLGSDLHIFPDTYSGGFQGWFDRSIEQLGTPAFGKNVSDHEINGVPSGWLVLHPGCHANEFALLRWTAPHDQDFDVQVQFFAGHYGNTSAYVLWNEDTANPLFATDSTNSDPGYAATLTLSAGDTLDFVVGTAGDCYGDSTPITAVIQSPNNKLADMNCDGAVDFNDIDPFVLALISQDDYESQYPDCRFFNGDINGDDAVNFNDIDGFVDCLINNGCP